MDFHYFYFFEINSTQTFLIEQVDCRYPLVCRAEQQTDAFGQRSAKWHSPNGGLYFSIRCNFAHSMAIFSGITQAITLKIASIIDPLAENISIKWPNDLLYRGKKFAGVLVQTYPNKVSGTVLVVGIGINIAQISKDFAAVLEFSEIDKEELFTKILLELFALFDYWDKKPYLTVDHQWNKYDIFYDKDIYLEGEDNPVRNLGIDQKGRLMVLYNGKIRYLVNTRISKQAD